LAPGTYYVRVKASGTQLASADSGVLTIGAGTALPSSHHRHKNSAFSQRYSAALNFEGGIIRVNPTEAAVGDAVTLTAVPNEGWQLARIAVRDAQGKKVATKYLGNEKFSFAQPDRNVQIVGVFAPIPERVVSMPKVLLSPQRLLVNGAEKRVEAYNIGGTNFFRLRDLAELLKGLPAEFDVEYDAQSNGVTITNEKAYSGSVTGESIATDGQAGGFADKSDSAAISRQAVKIDSRPVFLTAYNIGGNNFFSLRELAYFFGYGVTYDENADAAGIESK
jgi:hypothetical protein